MSSVINSPWQEFKRRKVPFIAFSFLCVLSLMGIYAPFFASSKPLIVVYEGTLYFPLFRYLFFQGFFTKPIDIFFNVLMFILPLFALSWWACGRLWGGRGRKSVLFSCLGSLAFFTILFCSGVVKDPAYNPLLVQKRKEAHFLPNFDHDLILFTPYEKLSLLISYKEQKKQKELLAPYAKEGENLSLLFDLNQRREREESEYLKQTIFSLKERYKQIIDEFPHLLKVYLPFSYEVTFAKLAWLEKPSKETEDVLYRAEEAEKRARKPIEEAENLLHAYQYAEARSHYIEKKSQWLKRESENITFWLLPFFRVFHWEEDAGGAQSSNPLLPWWERTRLNRKDLTAALIFGVRISLIVGLTAVCLSLIIGIPLGLCAGFFAGKVDMITLRFIEIWEAMPTFFTLLLISSIFHSKSLFLTILILGLFGWTGFARFIRAESLRERSLAYVMASKSLGFGNFRIMFKDVLPNAISPILALLPFSMMAAITSEAALSFLGLGEEGSTSWGVLMSEARTVFPGESYLLWPPALLLTAFLVATALVGDGWRDALDPKER